MRFNPSTSTLAGVSTATLQTWLANAQQAMADLMSGGKVVSITITGAGQHREVTYTRAELGQLTAWIKLLQAQLGLIRAPRRGLPIVFT